jgi:tRNA-intron endonuclease
VLDKADVENEKNKDAFVVPVEASLEGGTVKISSTEGVEEFSSKGYGVIEEGKLNLMFYEALFLLGKKAIEITERKTGRKIVFQDILKYFQQVDKDAWVKYLVYRDLRSRGYVAREGFGLGIDFRVYDRGDYGRGTAKILIFCIKEGQPVTVEKIARTQRYVQSLKKNLVLAVINRRGEIVYYSLTELNLE